MRDFPGKQYTNLDATQVIRTGEHADGCRVDAHAFPIYLNLYALFSYTMDVSPRQLVTRGNSGISAITKICNKLGNLLSENLNTVQKKCQPTVAYTRQINYFLT
ncbi:hypothetical protein T12_12910 [Trichinella patagoniensis]|uniref:Uncharacterized protein n=1 Tax=Trichinella patagoniensis TaxID=990121 RepID=A0A0V0Z586_9BILA|nr:hypothetical protein T12_12910 [Trichinella patagoniensis]